MLQFFSIYFVGEFNVGKYKAREREVRGEEGRQDETKPFIVSWVMKWDFLRLLKASRMERIIFSFWFLYSNLMNMKVLFFNHTIYVSMQRNLDFYVSMFLSICLTVALMGKILNQVTTEMNQLASKNKFKNIFTFHETLLKELPVFNQR